eukprot:CAMPEP_0119551904 /NCGR_PEP_ID=MMETSP1352-20130426/5033_1 /TAXON_ID=265584 /ORGANISM="Stauroneis constricta, Strain CCMP1120" /LENGTH=434 /DNA_ID=CAMNT_0007598029 /DNA_START=406 /DNA_END=1710 /DNA_ORIENTATION=+
MKSHRRTAASKAPASPPSTATAMFDSSANHGVFAMQSFTIPTGDRHVDGATNVGTTSSSGKHNGGNDFNFHDGNADDDDQHMGDPSSSYSDDDDDDEDLSSCSSDGWDSDLEEMESWMLKNKDPILKNGQLHQTSGFVAEHHRAAGGSGMRRIGSYSSLPSKRTSSAKRTSTSSSAYDELSRSSDHTTKSDFMIIHKRQQAAAAATASYNDANYAASNANNNNHKTTANDIAVSTNNNNNITTTNTTNTTTSDIYSHIKPEEFLKEYVLVFGYTSFDELQPKKHRYTKTTDNNNKQSIIYPQAAKAARTNDLRTIQSLPSKELQYCCNKYGESIIHIACRRGHIHILQHLITTVQSKIRIQDDYGRTPLHDAAWTETPNFELVSLLLRHCPDLLFVRDQRGYLAVSYIPHCARTAWIQFFMSRPDLLEAAIDGV